MFPFFLLFSPFFLLFAKVETGLDLFLKEEHSPKKVALIINHTSCDAKAHSSLDLFQSHPSYEVIAIFAPEHGIEGDFPSGKKLSHTRKGDIPVYSLFGKRKRPTKNMLQGVELIIYDLQSIGARSYSYETTLFYIMEEAAFYDIPVAVLDRPNPLGGMRVEGILADPSLRSFNNYIDIPECHGMTIGELATFFNAEYEVGCDLHVVRMKGWKRPMYFSDTELPWLPTSSNIPDSDSPLYYQSTALFREMECMSTGDSYTLPGKVVAAPWINGAFFAKKCNEKALPGVRFLPFSFRPFKGKFEGELLEGVLLQITDKKSYRPLSVQYLLLGMLKTLYPEQFLKALSKQDKNSFLHALGSNKAYQMLIADPYPFSGLMQLAKKQRKTFLAKRKKYLFEEYDF